MKLSFPRLYICNLAFFLFFLLLGLQLCCCVLYIGIFSSSLYLRLLGALSVLFWYSFSLHLCLCYSFVYKRRRGRRRKINRKKTKHISTHGIRARDFFVTLFFSFFEFICEFITTYCLLFTSCICHFLSLAFGHVSFFVS